MPFSEARATGIVLRIGEFLEALQKKKGLRVASGCRWGIAMLIPKVLHKAKVNVLPRA